MAIVNTPNLISGRIGGLIYYVRDGKQCVRSMPVHDKKKHASAPTMEPVRRHNAEFSAASRAGAVFRSALGSWRKAYSDAQFSGKVTSLMFQIVSHAAGEKGRRPLHIHASARMFNRLPLNAAKGFTAKADKLVRQAPNDAKATVNLRVADLLAAPTMGDASAYRWVTLAFSVPDFEFSNKTQQYEPTSQMPASSEVIGEWLPLSNSNNEVQMAFPLVAGCAQFLALGLELGRKGENGFEVIRELSLMEIFNLHPSESVQMPSALVTDKAKLENIVEPVTILPKLEEVPSSEPLELPEVKLRKVEDVPVELVLPDSHEDLDLDFEPARFERPAPQPVAEHLTAPSPVLEVTVDSLVAESLGSPEEVTASKPKREKKARPAKEVAESEPKAKQEKTEKAKSDSGQLSLFF